MKKPTSEEKSEQEVKTSQHIDYGTAPGGTDYAPEQEGVGMGGVLMLRQIAPMDWIQREIVPKGKGYRENVGRIVGKATGYNITKGNLPNDKEKESVKLTGTFSMESLVTGEVTEGHTIYLPDNVSRRVAGALDMLPEDDKKAGVIMDVDIGVRNTGSSIPYEWTATSYVKDQATEMLRQMRSARRPSRIPMIGTSETKLIEG